jgi:hypothetical protein
MLVAVSVNKLSKIHKRLSADRGPFQYDYAQLEANVCSSGMAELRMICRGRASILGLEQVRAQGARHFGPITC